MIKTICRRRDQSEIELNDAFHLIPKMKAHIFSQVATKHIMTKLCIGFFKTSRYLTAPVCS